MELGELRESERGRKREAVGADCEMQAFEIFCLEDECSYWKQVILFVSSHLPVLKQFWCIVGLGDSWGIVRLLKLCCQNTLCEL